MTGDDLLTPREREVLALMAAGKTNGDISRELAISFPTAKAHVSSVLAKFDVASREEAVARWQMDSTQGAFRRKLALVPLALVLGAAVISAGIVLVARVLFADGSTDRDEQLVIPLSELEAGVPRHFELDGFGESPFGGSYGAWVTLFEDGHVTAFFNRDPHSGCAVPWREDFSLAPFSGVDESFAGQAGAYRDGCGGWTYLKDSGRIIFGASPRGLDSFPVRIAGPHAVVDLTTVQLGLCHEPGRTADCSPAGQPRFVSEPPPPIIPDWGQRGP